jgi:hypothetical protein
LQGRIHSNSTLRGLKHLEIIRNFVHIKFDCVHFNAFVACARDCMSLQIADLAAFSGGLERLRLAWKYCCATTCDCWI